MTPKEPSPGSVTVIEGKEAVILPKEPKCPPGGFDGWSRSKDDDEWVAIHGHGLNKACIYAAPIDSEVARLNGYDDRGHLTNPDGSKGARLIVVTRPPDELQKAFATPPGQLDGETPRTDAVENKVNERPTSSSDSLFCTESEYDEMANHARTLERETRAQAGILNEILRNLPVGYLPNHTIENLPAIVTDWVKSSVEATDALEKAEEKIEAQAGRIEVLEQIEQKWIRLSGWITRPLSDAVNENETLRAGSDRMRGALEDARKEMDWMQDTTADSPEKLVNKLTRRAYNVERRLKEALPAAQDGKEGQDG